MAYDEDLAERIREFVSGAPGVSEKRMFGGLAFLVNGHLAVSASGKGGLLLRADPEHTEELLSAAHVEPFVMRGREMSGWLRVGPGAVKSDAELRQWIDIGVEYARSLPPK
jgi:TfoX/Sxy family transcriptional regulator of competence genes